MVISPKFSLKLSIQRGNRDYEDVLCIVDSGSVTKDSTCDYGELQ